MLISVARDQPEEVRARAMKTRVKMAGVPIGCIRAIDTETGRIERIERYQFSAIEDPGGGWRVGGTQVRDGRCTIVAQERAEDGFYDVHIDEVKWQQYAVVTDEEALQIGWTAPDVPTIGT